MEECKETRYSFTDAAEIVLDQYADKCPMHYRDITDKIMDLDLVDTEGKTPDATLYSLVLTEIKRFTERGEKKICEIWPRNGWLTKMDERRISIPNQTAKSRG
jgi:hypothetical protein